MNCTMRYFWKAERGEDIIVPPHEHNCFEIVYYKIGSGSSNINSENQKYSSNSIAFINPSCLHDEIHFTPSQITCIGFELQNISPEIESGIYHLGEDKKIDKLVRDIAEEVREQKNNYEKMISIKIEEIILLLSRQAKQHNNRCKDISYVVNYLNENYDYKIKFTEIASICGYSYSHFRHQFKEKMGVSPHDYLISIRLKQSEKMLKNTSLSLTEIALMCGFSNSAQFSSMFKNHYGTSPLKFRKTK